MYKVLKLALDVSIIAVLAATAFYVYDTYADDILAFFTSEEDAVVFIDNIAVSVSVADDPNERRQGLSDLSRLDELSGKLFIFDTEDYHGIWMKDMNFPIDIIYIDNDRRIVDIIENVSPDSYPKTFRPAEPARFVLETNALFTRTFSVEVGDRVSIPTKHQPPDIRGSLQ